MYQNFKTLLIVCTLFISVFIIQSCEDTTSSELDNIGDLVNSVEPINGANNVTMDLENDQSQGSKFLVTYGNIESNPIISNGQKAAWCVEWDMPALYEVQTNVTLYKTEGTEYWKEINYLLSQEEQLRSQNPGFGWREMQVAIWTLIKYKDFEIDNIPEYQGLGRYYEDGEYLFDVELTKSIIEQVTTNATTNGNQKYAIIAENEGQTIITASE